MIEEYTGGKNTTKSIGKTSGERLYREKNEKRMDRINIY